MEHEIEFTRLSLQRPSQCMRLKIYKVKYENCVYRRPYTYRSIYTYGPSIHWTYFGAVSEPRIFVPLAGPKLF